MSDEDRALTDAAVSLAAQLIEAAAAHESRDQRRRRRRLARLVADPLGRAFTLALTDEVVRIDRPGRAAERLQRLVDEGGLPGFLGPVDRLMLRTGAAVARRFPHLVMPLVTTRLRSESAAVVLPADQRRFARHAARRRRQGIRLNVSLLGEAILGEQEAERRLEDVIGLLGWAEIDYVSVKISSICSQLDVLAFEASAERVAERLRRLYRAAQRHSPAKFVNLDMEEYRDLELTATVFRRVLDEPELLGLDAGIVLQAYLPDSYRVLQELTEWAEARRARGGGGIKVRIVKGANLAMEQVEAELHGWPQAPYSTKADVDANYKRMLDWVLQDRFAAAVRVGVASHNLFDVAWAVVLREARGAADRVELEMLEGMANSQARAVRDVAGDLLLYAPIARRDDFDSSIAYLVRRLDENTAPENFLRQLFTLRPGSPAFEHERDRFLAACRERETVSDERRRQQDRGADVGRFDVDDAFANEPDTDFTLPANRAWIEDHLASWPAGAPREIPAVVAGSLLREPLTGVGTDPSDPTDAVAYRYVQPRVEAVDLAVASAAKAQVLWAASSFDHRRRVLTRVAEVMAAQRGRTIAAMAHDAGKVVGEGDVEVSEAVDFARWYADATRSTEETICAGLEFEPHGVVVVAPPWNFPYAIPAGGVLAALAAGNAVVLKPAPETVLTAWLLATHCWAAGVPRDVLQFVPCADDEAGQRLISHPDVGAVVLTGAWDTAELFRSWRPEMRLLAETSGKNAIVITAAADLDAAVRDLVGSAFGHAGQKCSAASLAIVEASVYDDPAFHQRLADAAGSLEVGPAWQLGTAVGPVIRPPEGALARELAELAPGESWLVEPRMIDANRRLWSPGVKVGVRPGSRFQRSECFGPVLGVMRAADLDEAVRFQNDSVFGLTGGIHTLDQREIERWLDRVEVGNAYVNRPITGAIVRRQPFGGWKRSAVGAGSKAGGPNYLHGLGRWRQPGGATDASCLGAWWDKEFGAGHDPSGLTVESNLLRYRPLAGGVLLRAGEDVSDDELEVAVAAAATAGVPLAVSSPSARPGVAGPTGIDLRVETDDELAGRLTAVDGVAVERLRIPGEVAPVLRTAALAVELELDDAPVVDHGRIELLHWVREQSVSRTLHRYGVVPGPNRSHEE